MITRRRLLHRGLGLGAAAATLSSLPGALPAAFAAVFMDAAQARAAVLSKAVRGEPYALPTETDWRAKLAESTGLRITRNWSPKIERGLDASGAPVGWVVFDQVVGKYELIDFAVGLDTAGTVLGLEIMAYRESHGSEIRNAAWRRQFVGRKGAGQLRFGEDILNISGATMSCRHLTEGVQRIGALHALLLAGAA